MVALNLLPSADLENRLVEWYGSVHKYPCFDSGVSDLSPWFHDIESGSIDHSIPKQQWADAAIFFLTGDLKIVMQERRDQYIQKTEKHYWDWEDFKQDISHIVDEADKLKKTPLSNAGDIVSQLAQKHPYIVASAGWGLIIGGSAVLVPALGLAALNAVGFTAGGVVGGSLAASLQSLFYGGFTTGVFSMLQSFAATSVAVSAASVATASTAVGAGLGSIVYNSQPGAAPSQSSQMPSSKDVPPPYSPDVPYAVYKAKRKL